MVLILEMMLSVLSKVHLQNTLINKAGDGLSAGENSSLCQEFNEQIMYHQSN